MKFNFLLFFFLLPFSLKAQQIISGKVVDLNSKDALAYASVYWKSDTNGVLSDDFGEFSIPSRSNKKDTLVVSFIGYESTFISQFSAKEFIVELKPNDLTIEEVIVTPINPEEIIRISDSLFYENHFRENSKQLGFMRTKYYNSDTLFQVSETAYSVHSFLNDKKGTPENKTFPSISRTIFDSAQYKLINEAFHLKKDTVLFEPESFLGIGQNFRDDGDSKERFDIAYEYNGITNYQGRDAYDISITISKKKRDFAKQRKLIDKATYAILSSQSKTVDNENLNKMIPFAGRALISLLGYKYSFQQIDFQLYFRFNGEYFEYDKGSFVFAADIARKKKWLKGKIVQEFYLSESSSSSNRPLKQDYFTNNYVNEFEPDYFKNTFHLPTSLATLKQIEVIQENNSNFNGTIISDRHKKWLKKKNK